MTHRCPDNPENAASARRARWQHRGGERPPFAIEPGPGQESVWDYPRPPALVADDRLVEVYLGGRRLARSQAAYRVLETAGPPTFYLPPADVDFAPLEPADAQTYCEWKGSARYWAATLTDGRKAALAWTYPEPSAAFAAIAGYVSFYPGLLRCFVAGQRVRAQTGGFYGGWITDEIVGPFKGEPGTEGW